MEGEGFSKSQLREIGEELMAELKERRMNVVEEEVSEDRTIEIRGRNL